MLSPSHFYLRNFTVVMHVQLSISFGVLRGAVKLAVDDVLVVSLSRPGLIENRYVKNKVQNRIFILLWPFSNSKE
jgi:hypothetical protein